MLLSIKILKDKYHSSSTISKAQRGPKAGTNSSNVEKSGRTVRAARGLVFLLVHLKPQSRHHDPRKNEFCRGSSVRGRTPRAAPDSNPPRNPSLRDTRKPYWVTRGSIVD